MTTKLSKTFKAEIWSPHPSGAWKAITVPFSVEREWGIKSRVPVLVKIGTREFRTSIMPNGTGKHHMMFNKQMQQAAGTERIGDTITITLTRDDEKRVVDAPQELAAALAKHKAAQSFYERLAPSHKKAYVDWITSAKKEETRAARIERAITMLSEGKKYD